MLALFFWMILGITQGQTLEERIKTLAGKYNFTYQKMEVDTFFTEKYMLYIPQPVDHYFPEGKTFTQRVILSHKGFDRPVVFVTEGYSAAYAENSKYINELSYYLKANQIVVEHRYFNKSVPDTLDWDYLTVFNAASDHHKVVQILKELYPAKWVNTGISKGGQTAVYHRYFYPEDVDATVGYVCPINFSKADRRSYEFLKHVGTKECRDRIFNFQKELLKNKDKYLPEFKKLAKQKKLTYRMGEEKGFELTVFEFAFAFWQWGTTPCDSIPVAGATRPKKMIAFLDKVAGLNWISDQGIEGAMQPFFIQAMKELGMYGYNIEPFKAWTTYQHNVSFEFTIPKGVLINYSPDLMEKVDFFIRHQAYNLILIYGETDAWSFAAAEPTLHTNAFRVIKPGGSHLTRIGNLPEAQRKKVLDSLNVWLGLK